MRALGIDYGERRIGLALSDVTGLLASPWKTLPNTRDLNAAASRLRDEIAQLQSEADGLEVVVLGLPRRLSGDANDLTPRVEALAGLLRKALDVRVDLQDERLTSREADELLARRERDWRKRKTQVDAMAAALILQDYLDSRTRS